MIDIDKLQYSYDQPFLTAIEGAYCDLRYNMHFKDTMIFAWKFNEKGRWHVNKLKFVTALYGQIMFAKMQSNSEIHKEIYDYIEYITHKYFNCKIILVL